MRTIGVLALQGDVREHQAALARLGADSVRVRRVTELDAVDGIIIASAGRNRTAASCRLWRTKPSSGIRSS